MLIPFTVDVPMERWPIANWALIAVTSIVSIAILAGAGRGRPDDPRDLLKDNADPELINHALQQSTDPVPPLALRPRAFRFLQLFSCLFVHLDPLHLIGNMIFLFVFGNAVNAKLGQFSYVVSYLLLGATASCAWLLLGNGQPAAGASGAIMGVIGVFLVLYPRNDITMLYMITLSIAGSFTISSYWVILFYLACDLYGTVRDGSGAVAYVAHLGGAVSGLLGAAAAVGFGFLAPTRYERNLLQLAGWEPAPPRKKKKKKRRREEIAD